MDSPAEQKPPFFARFKPSSELFSRVFEITRRTVTGDFFLPALFLVLYGLFNAHYWKAPLDEVGDAALIGLQTVRASAFEETVGPYSRVGFHHPGPITFYAYALFDRLLPFIVSSDVRFRVGQWLLNTGLFLWGVSILRRLLPSRGWLTPALIFLLIGTSPLDRSFLISVWGPHILVVSYFLFFMAYLSVLEGKAEFLAAAVSAVFILHNHISGATLLLPMASFAAWRFFQIVRNRAQTTSPVDWKPVQVLLAVAFILLTSVPPLMEQFLLSRQAGAPPGNLGLILKYFTGAGAAARKAGPVLAYITGYYGDPLKGIVNLPGVVAFAVITALPLFAWGRIERFWRGLYVQLLFVFVVSLLSAFRVSGDLLPHLFWHLYPFVGFQLLVFGVALVSLLEMPIPDPQRLRLHGAFTVIALCATVFHLPEPRQTSVGALYDSFRDHPGPYRLVFPAGSPDHDRWVEAAGLALKIVRSGGSYCVDPEWWFMFPRGSVCENDTQVTTVRLTKDPVHGVRADVIDP